MKKLFAMIALLLCLALPTAGAEGFSFGATVNVTSAVSDGGAICVYDSTAREFRLTGPDGAVRAISAASLDGEGTTGSVLALTSDGAHFYAVVEQLKVDGFTATYDSAALYRLDFDASAIHLEAGLDLSEAVLSDGGFHSLDSLLGAEQSDGRLYLLFYRNGDSLPGQFDLQAGECYLLCCDLAAQTASRLDLDGEATLIAAQGALVMLAVPAANDEVQLVMLDTASGSTAQGWTISGAAGRASCFDYDAGQALLYYSVGNRVWRMDTSGNAVEVAALPEPSPQGIFALGDRVAAWTAEGVSEAAIQSGGVSRAGELTVYGSSSLLDDFSRAYPEISLTVMPGDVSLIDAVLTQSSVPDVMLMSSLDCEELRPLIDRGYLLPLDSAAVSDVVSRMYPEIASAVTTEAGIVALPFDRLVQLVPGVDEALWTELGLGDLPETWADLFAFLRRWPEIQAAHPDLRLLMESGSNEGFRGWVLDRMIEDYEFYRTHLDEPAGYDTEVFRSLLAEFESIDFDALFANEGTASSCGMLTFYCAPTAQKNGLFSSFGSPIPLRVMEGAPVYAPMTVYFIAINPYSQNIDAAKALVEFAAQHLDPLVRIELMPGENAPVRVDGYEESLAQYEAAAAAAQSALDACEDPAERVLLEQSLAEAQAALEDYREDGGWLANEESIAGYRAVAEHILIYYRDALYSAEAGILADAKQRYLDGDLPADQLIAELERRYVMREREAG